MEAGPFGSNTAHCVPLSTECSGKAKNLRRFTYFQSGSGVIVRAHQTRKPRPSQKRRQFTPWRFSFLAAPFGGVRRERCGTPCREKSGG